VPDPQQFWSHPRKVREHGVDEIFGILAPPRERQGMAKERGLVAVVDLAQRGRPARRQIPEQFPVTPVIARAWHS
jgi:hypothetical protein